MASRTGKGAILMGGSTSCHFAAFLTTFFIAAFLGVTFFAISILDALLAAFPGTLLPSALASDMPMAIAWIGHLFSPARF